MIQTTNLIISSFVKKAFYSIGKNLQLILPALLLIGLAGSYIIGVPSMGMVGLVTLGPPFIGAAIVFLSSTEQDHPHSANIEVNVNPRFQSIVFFFLLALALFILHTNQSRPIEYFIVASAIYISILFRILASNNKHIVLIQIALVFMLSVYSVTLKYPFYIGNSDILAHLRYANHIYTIGTIVPENLAIAYNSFPLFHILIALSSEIFDVPVKYSWALIAPLMIVSTIPIVYKLSTLIFGRADMALCSALIFATLPDVVFYGQYMITRVAAAIGFFFALYLILKHNYDVRFAMLSIVFLIYLLFVHQVTLPQSIIILLLLYFAFSNRAYTNNQIFNMILLSTVLCIGYWVFVATSFTEVIIASRIEGLLEPRAVTTPSGSEQKFNSSNFYLNTYVTTFFLLVGIRKLLVSYDRELPYGLGVFLLITTPLYIPNPISSLWITQYLFRIDRFYLLLSPFLAITIGYSLFYLLKSDKVYRYLAVGSVCIFIITSVWAGTVAPVASDANQLTWTGPPKHLEESEIQGIEFVHKSVPNKVELNADRSSQRYINEYLQLDREHNSIKSIRVTGNSSENEGTILRAHRYENGGITVGPSEYRYRIDINNTPELLAKLEKSRSRVYDSGSVRLYLAQ
ncbi:hypothetical protein HUG10_07490 [Halorarum halophilum]|uniref:Dolichyl-phosphate-mannose-protein mannosyltransferase n=1 Tax=Halorarum halophilum TaxID=2743090 RepID=A0A7D5K7D2_9EURY|nr:hypothetical protein [Halobaculum halophilum]QLG27399.1 hypothetical protein HUG10_07490 [Halobaculum halophilum]